MKSEVLTLNAIRKIILEEMRAVTRFKNGWRGFSGGDIKSKNFKQVAKEKKLKNKFSHDPGAGFLIYKNSKNGIKVLALIMNEDMRDKKEAIFDIPKGGMDEGENYIRCAIRECEEETGIVIDPSDILLPGFEKDSIKIFPVMSNEKPVIRPNPHSGIIEHSGYMWVEPEVLLSNCIPWLKIYITECLNQIMRK